MSSGLPVFGEVVEEPDPSYARATPADGATKRDLIQHRTARSPRDTQYLVVGDMLVSKPFLTPAFRMGRGDIIPGLEHLLVVFRLAAGFSVAQDVLTTGGGLGVVPQAF